MQNNNTLIIIVAVVVLIIAFYFISQNNKSKAADAAIATSPIVTTPVCVPFTKAEQDEQKKELNKICAKKQLIPVIGVFQFTSCLAKVDAQLTKVKTCP